MQRWSLSDLALDRPVTVGMALLAILLLGVVGIAKMPLSYLPLDQTPRMFVRVNITRTSPEVLEREVIRPIEEKIAGIRDLKRIQVGSGSWGMRINLDFDPGTDIDTRKIELRDRIERVRPDLPDFVQNIEIGSYANFDDPVMELRLSSGTDLSEDYYLIEERVVRPLERIKGVARVELEGVSPHELEVAVDLESASNSGIGLGELGDAVRNARQGRSLGTIRSQERNAGLRTPASEADPQRFSEIPLRRNANAIVPAAGETEAAGEPGDGTAIVFAELGEVAKVSAHPEQLRRAKRLNGRSAVNLEIHAAAGASAVEVSRAIRKTVDSLREDPALDGIELLVEEDQGGIILNTLTQLRDTGIYGGLLGVVVLFLFLHRVPTTLSASVSIPLSVLAACAVLFLRGDDLNCVVMLGLVIGIGMLIDNAVVIVESITLHAQRGAPPVVAAREGARDVGFATIASTLSSIIVFVPLLTVDSMSTKLDLSLLASTFAIALSASLLVSQTAVPLLMGRLLGHVPPRVTRHPFLDRVAAVYGWIITRTLRFPRLTMLVGLALAASAAYPATRMNIRLGDDEIKPDNLSIRLQLAGSRGMEKIEKIIKVLEASLLEQREALNIASVSCSLSDFWGRCRIYPSVAFESEADVEKFEQQISGALPEQVGVEYRLGERDFDWRENRDRKVVEFALKGEDMGELMRLGEDVGEHLRTTLAKGDPGDPEAGGFDTVTTPFSDGARELHVNLEGDRLQALGLSADEVAQRVSLAFQGLPLGKVRGERGELSLRLSAGKLHDGRSGIAALRDLRLATADGREVPLSSVADIGLARRPFWIQRVDRQTEVRLRVRFLTPDMKGNMAAVSSAMSSFSFPAGYSWGRGTKWKRRQQGDNTEMLIFLGLCLLLVYAVMASLFESFLQPLGILVTCLLGCFGAPWALMLTGTTLDTTAVVGFFILIGIVVNNGIMLVDKVTQLRQRGLPRQAALRQAAQDRIRPILMTMTTTVLGLLPMLIHHPTMAGIYYHAIALVIAGGLATSTVVTLVFLPAAYTLIEGYAATARRTWTRATRS